METFSRIVEEIKNRLSFMADLGCRGFECSKESLDIVSLWGSGKNMGSDTDTLEMIQSDLENCGRCGLASGRRKVVFGSGNPKARIVFVGEGPGGEEDLAGEPFVGAAGQLLTKIIQAIKLSRESVYICNIVKCRPPNNRAPLPDEIGVCIPFVKRQISVIQPEFVCALGSVAAQSLLNTSIPISKLRGQFHDYDGIKLLTTYHPAYLLRNPEKKREVWEDMKLLMKACDTTGAGDTGILIS